MAQLWQAHSEVAAQLQVQDQAAYEELSSALVRASQGRLLVQALRQEGQPVLPLELPGRMVAALVTADEGPLPAQWRDKR